MAEFDESKHPRDEDGKFTSKDGSKEYRQNTGYDEILNGNLVSSGAKSGALNPSSEEAIKHGELMYQTFRNIKSDVPKIAKVTGLSVQEIQKVKNYLFFNSEFNSDYDQAQSWDRLRHGKPIEADLILIKHELLEIEYRNSGMDYNSAHALAQKEYNYHEAITEYNNAIIEKERSKR